MRKVQFANDHYYHIYNRGVDKRRIFLEDKHYYRFIHDLYEFNDSNPITNLNWRLNYKRNYRLPISIVKDYRDRESIVFDSDDGFRESISPANVKNKRNLLVEIICFILMPTHFHLILKQLVEGGITKFMRKIGIGYVNYFNEKQDRTGTLFESRFKSIPIENDEYLMHLSRYIHLNCIDLIEPKWKEEGVKDWNAANKFLENYKWSSYLDYIGKKNVPSVINTSFLLDYFGSKEKYRQFTASWLSNDMHYIKDLTLE